MKADTGAARLDAAALGVLLLAAIILGGGGVAQGLPNLVVQVAALGVLALKREQFFAFWRDAPLMLRLLAGLTIAVPLLMLIPLPLALWTQIPGRDLEYEALRLADATGWQPFSLDPARTLVALLGLVVPLAVLALGWRLPRRDLIVLGWVIVGLGLVNFLIGVPQVLSNGQWGLFYPENPMPGVLFGSFANRNSSGLLLVSCLTLALLLPVLRPLWWLPAVRFACCASFVTGIVLTGSRSAMVLAFVPLCLWLLRWLGGHRRAILPAALGFAAAMAAALTILPGTRAETSFDRFAQTDDARTYIWEDARWAAQRYWPLGAGMGTFDEVFQIDESLENLTLRRAGRAHNDYLELAIEAGLPGLLLAGGWLALIAWWSFAARRLPGREPDRWIAWAGSAILLSIALQSLVDYPLRNQAMLALAALALVLSGRFGGARLEQGN